MATVDLAGTIDATSAAGAVLAQSVAVLEPLAAAELVPPNSPITFDFKATQTAPYVEDFEGASIPTDWLLCTPANSFAHTSWNSAADNWDHYQDGGDKVLRAQGRATAVHAEPWHPFPHMGMLDTVIRVKWHTDAQAGQFHRARAYDSHGQDTEGIRAAAAEIDSGGLRLVYYDGNSRTVRQTAAFSPSNGTWYYIRLQSAGPWGMRYRAKYWTGARSAEPGSWNLEYDEGLAKLNDRWRGLGVHNHGTGDAYFDKWEDAGQLDPAETALLTVEINGDEHTTDAGEVTAEPWVEYDNFFPAYPIMLGQIPDLDNWRITVRPRLEAYDPDGAQDVVVKWDGDTVLEWDFETSSFPNRAPEATGEGDPIGAGSHHQTADVVDPWGYTGIFLPLGFPQSFGYQEFAYPVAPLTYHGQAQDFRFVVVADVYTPVDGRYMVAHPVDVVIPAGFIPGEPKEVIIPGGIVPKGDAGQAFPAGLVPQGYVRHDHPGGFTPSVRFFYRGKASGVVAVRFLDRFKGSGVVYQVNRGNEIEVHVITEETYQALLAAGVDFE